MKILVTGGVGFIGTNTCLEARHRGHEVVAFDNFVRPLVEENIPILQQAGVKIVRGDIRNDEDFQKFGAVDAIVHLAGQCGIPYGQINPFYDFEVNAKGTINVLEYSRTHGKIPVAFASSNKVYTNIINDLPIKEIRMRYEFNFEDERMNTGNFLSTQGINEMLPLDAFGQYARSIYGTSKVTGDLYCQEYWQSFGVPVVIARMSCIYGYYQKGIEDQGWADWMLRQISYGDGKINIFGTGMQVRDMLFGTDVAKLYLDGIENIDKVKGKAYNIGGGIDNTMSLLEAIAYMEELTGKKARLAYLPKRLGDQDIWTSDIGKIKQDLGWEPKVSPKEGIKLMYEKMQRMS